MSLVVVVSFVTSVGSVPGPLVAAAAVGHCTGWTNDSAPPQTIRVLRSSGGSTGQVETVDFRRYVNVVIAAEWGASAPREALLAGAIAVKQYAWYWTMNWRGKTAASGDCYDVVDTTSDQVYRPEKYAAAQAQLDAIDATWTTSLRKDGQLFATGYRSGASVACGADANGKILFQVSLYRCASTGMLLDQLLHRYLDPGLSIVRPGSDDSTGDGVGDVIVVSPGADASATLVRIYSAGQAAPATTVAPAAIGVPTIVPLAPSAAVFRQFAEVTGDRLNDMIVLQRAGDARYQIWVAPATGDGFAQPQLAWDSATSGIPLTATTLVRFMAADFTGDGHADLALLVGEPGGGAATTSVPTPTLTPTAGVANPFASADPGASPSEDPTSTSTPITQPGAPTATLWVLPTAGGGSGIALGAATPIWTGPLDLTGTVALGGDVTGDSVADVVIQADLTKLATPSVGVRELVIQTGAANGSPPATWLDLPDTAAASTRTVLTDVNRDGRADIVIDRPLGAAGSQLLGLLSTGSSFTTRSLWSNAGSFRWSASRIAATDVNADGRGDVVVLYNAGAAGSKLYRFLSNGASLKSAGSTVDPGLPWQGAAPY